MRKLLDLFNPIQKYLLAAVLIMVPLYPKFPLFSIPGTYVAVRFEDLLLLALGALTLYKGFPKFRELFRNRLVAAIFLFFAIGAVSTISAVFVTQTANLNIGILHFLRRIEYVVPFFAVYVMFRKGDLEKNLSYFTNIIMLVIVIAFIYGFGQRYFNFPVIITQNAEYSKGIALRWTPGSHINSTFAGHYDMAGYLVLVLPIIVNYFFLKKEKGIRIIAGASFLAGMWLLVNSLSRISQVSYLFAVLAGLFLIKKYRQAVFIMVVSAAFIAASPGLSTRYMRVIEVYYQKIKSFNTTFITPRFEALAAGENIEASKPPEVFEDRSTSIRFNVEWPRAIRALKKNPLLGTGYSSIGLATDNDYLRLLGEVGILGFLAFVLVFVRAGKIILKAFPLYANFKGTDLAFISGSIAGLAATFISAAFIDLFEASKFATIFWLIFGIAIVMAKYKVYEQQN